MGFKRIAYEELETALSPSILGAPVSYIRDLDKKVEFEEKKLKKAIENVQDVLIMQKENIKVHSKTTEEGKSATGYGTITIINTSKKDRLWDMRLELSKSKQINIDCENKIFLGNLEPEAKESIQYKLINLENLPEPLKITEKVENLTLDLDTVNIIDESKTFQKERIQDLQYQIQEEKEENGNKKEKLSVWKEEVAQSIQEEDIQYALDQIFKLTKLPEKEKINSIEALAG
ncbi:MAG: hypothetical protein ACFFD2_08470, partial [Promethearchaeota archaeon]